MFRNESGRRLAAENGSTASLAGDWCFCCMITAILDGVNLMAKRGRPNKDGAKPTWTLLRSVIVLCAYDRARHMGEKHSAAVAAAVSALRSQVPEMPISETEVKRVLAEFRSKDSGQALIFMEGIAQGREADAWFERLEWAAEKSRGKWNVPSFPHDESKPRRLLTFAIQIGPRPRYPRHNSRS